MSKEKYKDAIKASKEIVATIDTLLNGFVGTVDKRQGIVRNPEITVSQQINLATGYVRSRPTGITATEIQLMDNAKRYLEEGLEKVNTFFTQEWTEYKRNIEATEVTKFKDIKQFRMN